MAASLLLPGGAGASAPADRWLNLVHAATGERFRGIYWTPEGGDPAALASLQHLLRDHHTGTEHAIDVEMLNFLADFRHGLEIDEVVVTSAYRTPETNRHLAEAGYQPALASQHLLGRAVDVQFRGDLGKAARLARTMERGGVGWYPEQAFLHLDSGPVRSWMGTSLSRPRRPLTVKERLARHRALARQQYLKRR